MYKYCLVPKCTNTTVSTPNKIFFNVPNDSVLRKKWCKLMKRDDKTPLSCRSTLHCCEDHFDVESDMENYIKYKLVGGNVRLRKGILPHKFECQKQKKPVERSAYEKRRRIEYYEKLLSPEVQHENLQVQPIEHMEVGNATDADTDPLYEENANPEPLECIKQRHKSTQVNMKPKLYEKSTQTTSEKQKINRQNNGQKKESMVPDISNSSIDSSSASSINESSSDYSSDSDNRQIDTVIYQKQMLSGTLMSISREPKLLLGIPKVSYSCLNNLSEQIKKPHVDILLTLRKIRLNEPNKLLGINFGCCPSFVGKKLKKTIPLIANCMQELIFWPPDEDIWLNLPVPFRKRYANVKAIIDCFEIQIEKPSNARYQALTWSQYKSCNTIKYLISITPDGLINFVSEGYGGRTSDSVIFEDSGFLEKLPPGASILADRGFKNIAHLLEKRGCTLIRPPSVTSTSCSSKQDVIQTKRIAALRVHVERSIGRLRDFNMIAPHACVDSEYVKMLDYMVVIACGIVNLQDCLFKS